VCAIVCAVALAELDEGLDVEKHVLAAVSSSDP
jgi:hypothetical protein